MGLQWSEFGKHAYLFGVHPVSCAPCATANRLNFSTVQLTVRPPACLYHCGRPNRLVLLACDGHVQLASLDPELELYLTLDPLADEATASHTADALRRYLADKAVQGDLLVWA